MSLTPRYAFDKLNETFRFVVGLILRRTPAGLLIGTGMTVHTLLFGAQFAVKINQKVGDGSVEASYSSGDIPPMWADGLSILATVCIVVGGYMAFQTWRGDRRALERKRVVAIELLGLDAVSATRLIDARPQEMAGLPIDILIDVREQVRGGTEQQLRVAVDKVNLAKTRLESSVSDIAREDLVLMVGARAPVGLQFLLGVVLDDEGGIAIWDFERNRNCWQRLQAVGQAVEITTEFPPGDLGPEVVLAVSTSYTIHESTLANSWQGLPVVRLSVKDPLPNELWSDEVQQDVAAAFLKALAQLKNRQVKHIHLALAACSSLTIRLGMSFDARNLPCLTVYQYEKQIDRYTWGVQMLEGNDEKLGRLVPAATLHPDVIHA